MRPEKELLKREIQDKMGRFDSFVIIKYAGLSANAANSFRREMEKLGGDIEVARKRVLLKAVADRNIALTIDNLPGHIGLVFLGSDSIESTKMVVQYSKDSEERVAVIGGYFDGKLYSGNDVERLATLPSKDEMRAQFLGLLEAPMAQTLAVMEALLSSVPYCLDNKANASEK